MGFSWATAISTEASNVYICPKVESISLGMLFFMNLSSCLLPFIPLLEPAIILMFY
jgi:hypothetical protein